MNNASLHSKDKLTKKVDFFKKNYILITSINTKIYKFRSTCIAQTGSFHGVLTCQLPVHSGHMLWHDDIII